MTRRVRRGSLGRMNSTRLPRTLVAVSLPLAAALMAIGSLVDPGVDESTSTIYMAGLARGDAATRYQVSALILHVAFLAFVPAIIGLWAIAKPGVARGVGAVLGLMGAATLPGLLLSDFYDIALAEKLPAAKAAEVADYSQSLVGANLLLIPALAGLVLGLGVLFVCAVRAGAMPAWAPVVIVLAMGLPIVLSSGVAFLVGSAIMLASLAVVGRRLLSGDDWTAGRAEPLAA